jgi:hypothetical protein
MSYRPRSLKYQYELFVDREIEAYKESVPRREILSIGDEAVQSLAAQQQLALTEILLCAEVDRIIRQRLRIPTYSTWRRRRLKALREFSRPERWGMEPDCALAHAIDAVGEGHVLVAGASEEGPALYLAANGCAVTALDITEDVVERVMNVAATVGLTGRVRGLVSDLANWAPDMPLDAVVCAAAAFDGLSSVERTRAIGLLQDATTVGGLHVVETNGGRGGLVSLEELHSVYDGWKISVERGIRTTETFLARKAVA